MFSTRIRRTTLIVGLYAFAASVYLVITIHKSNSSQPQKHLREASDQEDVWLRELSKIQSDTSVQQSRTLKSNAIDDAMDKVRILIMVMTTPKNLQLGKTKAVRDTWGKRADKVLYMSAEDNEEFPTIKIDVPDGRDYLVAKTRLSFRYAYEHYFNDFDWFMKADDDTYVIVENLKYFLSAQNSSDPIYFGHLVRTFTKQGYCSGGAGYVMSKEALRRLYDNWDDTHACNFTRKVGGSEDVELGRCFSKIGVKTGNTTDSLGRTRFHMLTMFSFLTGDVPPWMKKIEANGYLRFGAEGISDSAISFHYMSLGEMYSTDLALYHLKAKSGRPDFHDLQENRLLRPDVNLDYGYVQCILNGVDCPNDSPLL